MTDIICRIQGSTHFPPSGGVIDIGRGPCPVCGKGAVALTDQTPEALRSQLHAAIDGWFGCKHKGPQDEWPCEVFYARLLSSPTLAADLALAAAVRERFPNMTLAIEEDLDREHAARADADRLAEALRTIDVFRFHLEPHHWDKVRETLRLHDKAAKVVA